MTVKCKRCHRAVKRRGLCYPHLSAVGQHAFVDAAPTRARVALLRSRGYGLRQLAARTGLSQPTLTGKAGGAAVQAATEAAVMAIPVPKQVVAKSALLPALGTHRRVQALAAIGWSQTAIAAQADITVRTLSHIMYQSKVNSDNAAAIDEVFRRLAMTPGTCTRARNRASRLGWASPLAWEGIDIDNRDAKSDVGARRRVSFAERYNELRAFGVRNEEAIAKQLGIDVGSVADQCYRHGLERVS